MSLVLTQPLEVLKLLPSVLNVLLERFVPLYQLVSLTALLEATVLEITLVLVIFQLVPLVITVLQDLKLNLIVLLEPFKPLHHNLLAILVLLVASV